MLTTTASAHNASQSTSNFGPGRLGSREASLRAGARDKIGDLERRLERQSLKSGRFEASSAEPLAAS